MFAWEGSVTTLCAYALVKRTPPAASLSIQGVTPEDTAGGPPPVPEIKVVTVQVRQKHWDDADEPEIRINKKLIPVAIHSTPEFNALTEVDKASLTFGATGVEVLLAYSSSGLVSGNPMVATFQVASVDRLPSAFHSDVDQLVGREESSRDIARRLLKMLAQFRARKRLPRSRILGNTAFQITRGLTGISL